MTGERGMTGVNSEKGAVARATSTKHIRHCAEHLVRDVTKQSCFARGTRAISRLLHTYLSLKILLRNDGRKFRKGSGRPAVAGTSTSCLVKMRAEGAALFKLRIAEEPCLEYCYLETTT